MQELAKIDLSKCWNPLVYIENILTESKDQHWMSAKNDDKGDVFVIERRRLRAIFLETLELNDFPLDVQASPSVSIRMRLHHITLDLSWIATFLQNCKHVEKSHFEHHFTAPSGPSFHAELYGNR